MRAGPLVAAATYYVVTVFVIGFALGTVRTLFLTPRLGPFVAVSIELPFMLCASALVARALVRRRRLNRWRDRAALGAMAFVMLMIIEASFARLFGISLAGWFASLGTPAGLLGLAGQLGFAAMPALFQPASRFNA